MRGSDLFTGKGRKVIELALSGGRTPDVSQRVTDQLLRAILLEQSSAAAMALRSAGVNMPSNQIVTDQSSAMPDSTNSSESLWRIAELSWREALELGHSYIGPEHLLLAMTSDSFGNASLRDLNCDPSKVRKAILRLIATSDKDKLDS